ncbi:hypothetical protein [Flavobacterium sp. SORGH_AS_0622]|uniref:hypothetical protein n=1 Tax=Flavobacterium sp. SORGH_AS_0622 TaxID=3041772 RepID=UPI0027D78541|nr:hypothetical protein [Flavobacterium sp. SORGH_AS_0622]
MKQLYFTALIISSFAAVPEQTYSNVTKSEASTITKSSPQRKRLDTVKIELSNSPKPINPAAQIVIVKEKESASNFGRMLPIISTLTGLVVGFFLNRFYEWYINIKKIKKSGKRWNIELKTLEEPIRHQIKSIEEFKLSVAKREWRYDPLDLMTTINSERFSSLDKNDLMDYLEHKTKFPWYKQLFSSDAQVQEQYNKAAKISNHIHGFIDVLSHNFQHLNNKWDEFQDGISSTTKKLNQDLDILNNQINSLKYLIANDTQKLYRSEQYKTFFDLYFQFISHLNQNPNYNMHRMRVDFLDPAMMELAKLTKDNRILQTASSISILYTDLRAVNSEKDYLLDNMTELISRYNKSLAALAKIIEKLDEKIIS